MVVFEVRDEKAEEVLRDVGRILKAAMPEGCGLSLLIFSYGEGGNLFYTSSAQREDVIRTIQEFIQKLREN